LRSLELTGAILIYFSPINDVILPSDINLLYIGDGHPGIIYIYVYVCVYIYIYISIYMYVRM
jgi:hypothetical protein